MLELIDCQTSLTSNQWKIFTACVFSMMLDFLDLFLIGFILAFLLRAWHLTFGEAGAILLASGIGGVIGGILFGWLGDRIGRRKVFMAAILTFSLANGLMALTPDRNWMFIVVMRFIVGLGTTGLFTVDMPLLQEFIPASKRGWISGLSFGLLPLGPLLAATLSASLGNAIGWRGLFAISLAPALMAFLIRLWVPESPRWLLQQGRVEEARRALAWALRIDEDAIPLPAAPPQQQRAAWTELFKYPRSLAAGILTLLAQTGAAGAGLWNIVLLVLVLKVTPAEASRLAIWIALLGIPGRVFCSWMSETLGRRAAGALAALAAAIFMSLGGYLHNMYIGTASVFYFTRLLSGFFDNGYFSVAVPYVAELWPSRLRASGNGLVSGISNLGKIVGPAGLAVIAGTSNYIRPKATLAAMVPAFNYFAFWFLLAAFAFLFIGIETRGRTIEEIDAALADRQVGA